MLEHKLKDVNIRCEELLVTPRELMKDLSLDEDTQNFIYSGREQVRAILTGLDHRLIMKVGPCSIHDVEEAKKYFEKLKLLADKVNDKILVLARTYFEKPRTRNGWPGLLCDPRINEEGDVSTGARLSRSLLLDLARSGIYSTTELLSPEAAQYYGDLIVDASIGARTIETPNLRHMSSGLSMPVGLKNGTCGNIDKALDAVVTTRHPNIFVGPNLDLRGCRELTEGNQDSYMILRGGKDGPNYDEVSVRYALAGLKKEGVPTGIVVDASHANAMVPNGNGGLKKDPMKQPEIVYDVVRLNQNGMNVVGVMVESNTLGGTNKIPYPLEDRAQLVPGQSITDPCLPLDKTIEMIETVYKRL